MYDIPEEIKKFFQDAKDIDDCLLLSYYEYDNSHYAFIYEKDDVPFMFTCDKSMDDRKSAQIPYALPVYMGKVSKLEKENELLKKEVERLKNKN